MKTSLGGAFAIISHEGIVLTPYKDSKGVWTIGVGHTSAAGGPDPATFRGALTLRQAIDLFRHDLEKFERRVNAAFTVKLRQHEFDAAVSFDFNTGAIDSASWVKLFNQGRRDEAISAIMNWKKPAEIVGRRRKEQQLFATGLYSGADFAMLYPADAAGKVLWGQGKRIDLAKEYGRLPSGGGAGAQKPAPAPGQRPKAPSQPAGQGTGVAAAIFAAFAAVAAGLMFWRRKKKDD